VDEAGFVGKDDGLGAVVEVEFGVDSGGVGLDGGVADVEVVGDVGVREAAGDEAQDFELAWSEVGERRGGFAPGWAVGVVLDHSAGDRWREEGVTSGHDSDCNVRQAANDMNVRYPIALDSDHEVWRAYPAGHSATRN
jgi:hypothetical protein